MNTFPIFTTGTTLTSTGTAVTDLIPLDSAGATPRYIRVTATASGYFRTGKDTTAAVAGDMMVQPGDAVHLAVPGCLWFSFISVSGSARVTVSPLEIGSWDKRVNQWSLSLQFAGATALDPRITFTRASSATFTNSAGLVASAATDVPRFDYDPVTRQPKGLLIEEARTNVILYSGAISVANGWATDAVSTLATNQAIAPDGTLTASQLQFISNTYTYQNKAVTTATAYTWSVYAKLGTGGDGTVRLDHQTGAGYFSSTFNLLTGVVVSGAGVIQNVGNGWYRCSLTYTTTSTNDLIDFVMLGTFTAGQGHYIWGAQLEAGAFATSYIPTVAAQATRAAETAAINSTELLKFINTSAGTFLAAYATQVNTTLFRTIIAIPSGTPADIRPIYANPSNALAMYDGTNATTGSAFSINQNNKSAMAFGSGTGGICLNGGSITTGTFVSPSSLATASMYIGSRLSAVEAFNGTIKSITYWPRRLSNEELQAVTS